MTARKANSASRPTPDPSSLVLEGLQAHRAGRLDQARSLYSQALQAQGDHPDALNLLGALEFASGRTDAAIRLITRALKAHPAHFDAYLNLAEALEAAGRVTEAVDTCRKVLTLKPDFVDAYARLAQLQAHHGPADNALAYSRVALALDPDCVDALCAEGAAQRRLFRFERAQGPYRRALALEPANTKVLAALAALLDETDLHAEAAQLYRRALESAPQDLALWIGLGNALERSGDVEAALKHYERALELGPGSASALFCLACCHRDIGDFQRAEGVFRLLLATHPDHAPSLHALAGMKRLDRGRVQQHQLARLAADSAQPLRHRVQAGFALGNVLDQAGDPDAAFGRYTEANTLYRKWRTSVGEVFNRNELVASVDRVDQRLAAEHASDTGDWATVSELPVFVVGPPRSGTTLVEQICASHSQVVGAGELTAVQNIAAALAAHNQGLDRLANWDSGHARAQAEKHLAVLTNLGRGAARVVDKTPLNLMRLGVIGALFPRARVIRCHRDPRDIVVSNHTLYFGRGNLFSTDQRDCAFAVRQIERLGDCWRRESPLSILDVVYEDLVADLDTHVRQIVEFLGLDWEPACLEFQNTARRVMTPSSWQVRQPVYSTSVGRWRRYERHLAPMLATLAAP